LKLYFFYIDSEVSDTDEKQEVYENPDETISTVKTSTHPLITDKINNDVLESNDVSDNDTNNTSDNENEERPVKKLKIDSDNNNNEKKEKFIIKNNNPSFTEQPFSKKRKFKSNSIPWSKSKAKKERKANRKNKANK